MAMTTTFEEVLEKNGTLVYTNVGDSMMPLLREGRDLMVIRRKPKGKRLSWLDIPLYRRDSGQYVLHRIVFKRRSDYVCCGDNRSSLETGVLDRHVIGVLESVIRDGKTVSVHTRAFYLYSIRMWCRCVGKWALRLPLRAIRKMGRIVLGKR